MLSNFSLNCLFFLMSPWRLLPWCIVMTWLAVMAVAVMLSFIVCAAHLVEKKKNKTWIACYFFHLWNDTEINWTCLTIYRKLMYEVVFCAYTLWISGAQPKGGVARSLRWSFSWSACCYGYNWVNSAPFWWNLNTIFTTMTNLSAFVHFKWTYWPKPSKRCAPSFLCKNIFWLNIWKMPWHSHPSAVGVIWDDMSECV